jgi:hypothetical protein
LIGSIAQSSLVWRYTNEMGNSDAVLYGTDESQDSKAMAELLNELGVRFEYRCVSSDMAARREWEQLDGDRMPLLRVGNSWILRGFDRIKVQQLFGWVGC